MATLHYNEAGGLMILLAFLLPPHLFRCGIPPSW